MRYSIFLFAMFFLTSTFAQEINSIAELDIQLGKGQSLPLSNQISLELISKNSQEIYASLQDRQGFEIESVQDNSLKISMSAQYSSSEEVLSRHTKSSFVVDLEEASTTQFTSQFQSTKNKPVEFQSIVSYVDEYIEDPTAIHGFNIASVVASQRSGDCTEYAVLTTALARSLGIPSRIVIGSVIVEESNKVTAVGHAWSEVWHEKQWHILDAALNNINATRLFYLPAAELTNEGPGFSMNLVEAIKLMPQRIDNLRSH